jgi:hypothetical protein
LSNNDFSQYLIDIINAGSLSIMLSIGHRTRIFDVMTQLPPSTVQEIASKSNLNERYVKEWLGAMVTGRIVDYDSSTNKFSLSKEKAQFLTRENSIYNFAASMQWIPVLSQVEDLFLPQFCSFNAMDSCVISSGRPIPTTVQIFRTTTRK